MAPSTPSSIRALDPNERQTFLAIWVLFAALNLAVIPWGPLCGGLLTGKYDRNSGAADGRWQDGKDNFNREATPLAWDVIDLLREMAREKSCSVSQIALAWCGAQPGVTAIRSSL